MARHGRRRRDRPVGGHGHAHSLDAAELAVADPRSPIVRRLLGVVVALVVAAAVVGAVVLWPGGGTTLPDGYAVETSRATLDTLAPCPDGEGCLLATAEVDGRTGEVRLPVGDTSPSFSVGDDVLVTEAGVDDAGAPAYSFSDFDRRSPLLALTVLFALAVVVLSRWKGLASLASLVVSLVVVTQFVLPALLDGEDPLAVALVAAAAIVLVAVYGTQGVSVRSTVALVGTLLSLLLAAGIGAVFTRWGHFTGFSDESTKYLGAVLGPVDVQGLLLAGLIIGALGVLDDVTVTQTAAVWELAAADPGASRRSVFAGAMRIGRAHVSATVNTLVLAYVGASLPVLLLLTAADASLLDQAVSEAVAQEVVRGLAGSLGIVAAVPVTTLIAASVVGLRRRDEPVAAGR